MTELAPVNLKIATRRYDPGIKYKMPKWQKRRIKIIQMDRKCVYCDSYERLSVDHFIPFSKRFEYRMIGKANSYGNLVAACKDCNSKKGSLAPEKFFAKLPGYKNNFMRNYSSRNPEYMSERVLAAAGFTFQLQPESR